MSRPSPRRDRGGLRSQPALSPTRSVIEALEGRQMLAAQTLPVLIGGAAAKSVQFVDANGTRAIVRLLGQGNATVNFSGTALSQAAGPSGIAVSGIGVSLDSITLARTGLTTVLQVTTVGRTPVTIGGITSDGVMASILAPGVVVDGDVTTAGWVHRVNLAGATNGTLNIGPSHVNGGLDLTLGSATDENLVSAIRIDSLNAVQWASTTGGGDSIQAPQVMTVHIRGTFDPDLTVTGVAGARHALDALTAGAITAGTWSISGNVRAIVAGSIAAGWSANVSGSVDNVNVSHDATIDFTAPSVGSLAVHGTLADSTITLTQPLTPFGFDLKNLFVGGAMVSSSVVSSGSINAVTAGRMQDSTVVAGLVSPALPATTSDFANTAQIRSVTLRRSSASASFTGSDIAAYQIGNVILGAVDTANGGTPFGVAGHSLKSLTMTDQATNKSVHVLNLPTTAAFAALLASKGIAAGDFVVEIV